MKIYEYKDYSDYVANQNKSNGIKLHWVYVREGVIHEVATDKGQASSILCHGTRNGAEQKFFKKRYPDAFIVGTEISDTASQFPMTVQHDFTKVKEEWIGKFDIIYSNSIDHSISPLETLTTWRDQLSPTGRLYVEYSEKQSVCEASDPLMATNEEIKTMIADARLKIIKQFTGKAKVDLVFVCERKGDM